MTRQNTNSLPNPWLAPAVGFVTGFIILIVMNFPLVSTWIQLWITPAATLSSGSIAEASDRPVPPEPRLIIPKINVDAPVVYGMVSTAEPEVQKALESGILHYGNTALPGQKGNTVLVGHSSNNVWAEGDYKFVFALLEKLEVGDKFFAHKDSKRYTYQVSSKKVVSPSDVSVLNPTDTPVITLITCTPVGTNWNRLIIKADQVSPDPESAAPAQTNNISTPILPSN